METLGIIFILLLGSAAIGLLIQGTHYVGGKMHDAISGDDKYDRMRKYDKTLSFNHKLRKISRKYIGEDFDFQKALSYEDRLNIDKQIKANYKALENASINNQFADAESLEITKRLILETEQLKNLLYNK